MRFPLRTRRLDSAQINDDDQARGHDIVERLDVPTRGCSTPPRFYCLDCDAEAHTVDVLTAGGCRA